MALSDVLKVPTFYEGYTAAKKRNEGAGLAGLQQATAAQGLLEKMQQAQKQRAYEEALAGLGPNPTQEQLVQVASRHGGAETVMKAHQGSLDRQATIGAQREAATARESIQRELATARAEASARQAEMMHEFRMSQARTGEDRAAETARHNKVMEGIQGQLLELRGTNTPQPQLIQTESGPMHVGRDSRATPIIGPDGQPVGPRQAPERALPVAASAKLLENQTNLRRAESALALMEGKDVGEMKGDANATGWKGFLPDTILQRMDPQGTDARAALADLGSLVIHERSGAAVTAAEFPRLQPFIPKINDDPETVKKKLKRFAQIYRDVASETANFYKESGYKVPDLQATGGGGGQGVPPGVDPKVWAVMTPQERALWQK